MQQSCERSQLEARPEKSAPGFVILEGRPVVSQAQQAGAAQRRAIFVAEYLKDFNGARAAIAAGFAKGRAKETAARLLNEPEVQKAIADAAAARVERTRVDADWVLQRLAEEADADLADLYTEDGALKPVHQWPSIWRKGLVAGVEVEELRADGVVMGMVRKLKLSDRVKRLELIGKHVGVQAFREQVEHKGLININITPDDAKL